MTTSRQLPLIRQPGLRDQPTGKHGAVACFRCSARSPAVPARQAEWIVGQESADLVILTEVGAGPGGHALVETLSEHGYPYVLAPEPASA